MKEHIVCTTAGVLLLCLLAAPDNIFAATIHVPADKPTVQSAIDAAVSGDEILIAEGTFSGPGNRDIELGGKRLDIHGLSRKTIIDCGGSSDEHHGAFILRANDTGGYLVSLTITNAYYPVSGNDSGAITYFGGNYRLMYMNIENNNSHGISVLGPAAPVMSDMKISYNAGWGMYMPGYPYLSVGVRLFYSQIDHNSLGGMILSRAVEKTFVSNCTIADNGGDGLFLQGDLPMGSASYVWDTSTTVEKNVIAFNAHRGIHTSGFFTGIHYRKNLTYANPGGNQFSLNPDTACMLNTDPLFCRTAADNEYKPSTISPCLWQNNPCNAELGALCDGCTTCCFGYRGNVDCDPFNNIDISDLTRFIDYGYISFAPLCCFDAADMDGVGSIDISDLTILIDYLYISFTPPPLCP